MNLRPSIPAGCSTGPRPGNPSSIAESSGLTQDRLDSPRKLLFPRGPSYVVFNPPQPELTSGGGARPICRSSTGRRNGFGPDKCWVPQPITIQSGSIATMPSNGVVCGGGFLRSRELQQQLG